MSLSSRFFVARVCDDARIETLGQPTCHLGQGCLDDPPEQRAGVFVQWDWDGQRLRVSNDYSGYVPLFYACTEREICISESLTQVVALGAPLDWDETALAVFYRCGFFLGDHTPFKNIRTLPPGAILDWQDGTLSLSASRRIPKTQALNTDQAVDGYIGVFREAMRRHALPPEGTSLPLTGGRDSRQIALELSRSGKLPNRCVSCGDPRDIASGWTTRVATRAATDRHRGLTAPRQG
jgi:asparagine synthase (glutamine-hydrolysing)